MARTIRTLPGSSVRAQSLRETEACPELLADEAETWSGPPTATFRKAGEDLLAWAAEAWPGQPAELPSDPEEPEALLVPGDPKDLPELEVWLEPRCLLTPRDPEDLPELEDPLELEVLPGPAACWHPGTLRTCRSRRAGLNPNVFLNPETLRTSWTLQSSDLPRTGLGRLEPAGMTPPSTPSLTGWRHRNPSPVRFEGKATDPAGCTIFVEEERDGSEYPSDVF
nr:uncharacterized protein LOC102444145 isoform X2 [Pelodiscus sinensis]XP_025042644.1 uncharacterized protein LOC102444145 isoform X2 [Pelodiscus sinensis]|eukprot:XP_025042643.1 uncharacterized protein LOC102444145 isoform X2 [Pelodiscus sinensis]